MTEVNEQTTVSVIIPTYNREIFVEQAVISALSQSYHPLEILVIDDGSDDQTDKALKKYANKIRYIKQRNKGRSAARNKGIEMSDSKYIAFLDSDDCWDREYISKQVTSLSQMKTAGLGYTWYRSTNKIDQVIREFKPVNHGNAFQKICKYNIMSPSHVVIKRDCLNELNMGMAFNENISAGEDWLLWLNMAAKYDLCCIPEVLVSLRVHEENTYRSLSTSQIEHNYIKLASEIETLAHNSNKYARKRRMLLSTVKIQLAYMYYLRQQYQQSMLEYMHAAWFYPFNKKIYSGIIQLGVGARLSNKLKTIFMNKHH